MKKTPTIGLRPLRVCTPPHKYTQSILYYVYLTTAETGEIKRDPSNAARGSSDEMLTQHYRKADYLTKTQEL